MFLIAGLGNPGKEYELCRHNLGFLTIDRLSKDTGIQLKKSMCRALVGQGEVSGHKVILAKPQTFMNLSGESIQELSRWYKIGTDHIIVVHDDLDMDVGKLKIRPDGNSAGHKGIESVISRLGTTDFLRIRIGIGRGSIGDNSDYVLANVPREQQEAIDGAIIKAADAAVTIIKEGVKAAMNRYNQK